MDVLLITKTVCDSCKSFVFIPFSTVQVTMIVSLIDVAFIEYDKVSIFLFVVIFLSVKEPFSSDS